MVTTKEISAEFELAATAIIDREGAEMLELYRTEGDAEQVVHHFERNYRMLPLVDTPSSDICRVAQSELSSATLKKPTIRSGRLKAAADIRVGSKI